MSLRLGSLITNQITRIGKLFSVRTMIRERYFTAPNVTTGISCSAQSVKARSQNPVGKKAGCTSGLPFSNQVAPFPSDLRESMTNLAVSFRTLCYH
jgi:hypothetical protein